MAQLEHFKKVAIEAVRKAEERIMHYFHHLPPIEKKIDMTPVTQADREAEEIIIETIRQSFPDHGFLGEEFGMQNEGAEYTWIIDPIDGTKNFIHHLDFFGTILGLQYQDRIILGVSNMPALGELLFASEEETTTLNGRSVHVSQINSLEQAYVTIGGINQLDNISYLEAVKRIQKETLTVRGYGDIHGYHLVATGRADVMFEVGPHGPKAWDVSAYHIIVKQAGGRYSDFYGNESAFGPTSLATNGILHDEMLGIFSGVRF